MCRSAWQVQSNVIVYVNGALRVLTATVPAVDTARPPLPHAQPSPKLRATPAIHQPVCILFNYWLFWKHHRRECTETWPDECKVTSSVLCKVIKPHVL